MGALVRVSFILNRIPIATLIVICLSLLLQISGWVMDRKLDGLTRDFCSTQPGVHQAIRDYLGRPAQTMLRRSFDLDPVMGDCPRLLTAVLKMDIFQRVISEDKFLKAGEVRAIAQAAETLEMTVGRYWRSRLGSDPKSWRLGRAISSQFIHSSWMQLAFSLMLIWLFGGAVELLLGPIRFLFYSLACGILGDILYSVYVYLSKDWAHPHLGSSGMALGLIPIFNCLFPDEGMRLGGSSSSFLVSPRVFLAIFLVWTILGFGNPVYCVAEIYGALCSTAFGFLFGLILFRDDKARFQVLSIKAIG